MYAKDDGSTSKLRCAAASGPSLVYDVQLCGAGVRVKT